MTTTTLAGIMLFLKANNNKNNVLEMRSFVDALKMGAENLCTKIAKESL